MVTREEDATGREAVSAFANIRSDTHWRLGAVGAQVVSGTLEWSWTGCQSAVQRRADKFILKTFHNYPVYFDLYVIISLPNDEYVSQLHRVAVRHLNRL